MYRSITLEEDIALKQVIANRHGDETSCQRYNWRESLASEHRAPIPEIIVTRGAGEVQFSLADVTDTIGEALTDLLLSRQEQEERIYNDENRNFVTAVAFSVAKSLMQQVQRGGTIKLSQNDLYLLIEKALIENDAHDVAKSLVFARSYEKNGEIVVSEDPHPMPVRLIRRNGNVVPWSETKIETAVRKAFLDLRKDPEPASRVAHGVTQRVRRGDSAFVHIEDVQDLVEEELGRQGQYEVMRAYMSYRIQRAEVRKIHQAEATEDPNQDSMVVVTRADGQSDFWDGTELKRRIQFGMIGLDLCLSEEEIEFELRRSVGAEISEGELQRTIILNAKSLIERDADFAKFAARILLSYIYEEVLDWSIQRDGVAALKAAHQEQFRRYLKHGVAIKRISPELIERYDLERLSEAFDPSADLDFDYLGIQTLYDRYLVVDKTSAKPRRIETPQFFWMRVAMGLFRAEEQDREDWVIRLYQLYKGRRFCSSTPTLFNSGTLHSQLSSCYLYKVDDSIESIMIRGISENAFLSKWAGGLGGSWTSVRGTGAYIQGTNGESQGVIPFLKLHNDQLVAVNQGGKRRGSGCAYLESWHNDICLLYTSDAADE